MLAALVLAVLFSPQVTGDLTLAWDAATDNGLTVGYHVGVGTVSQSYPNPVDVGLVTQYTVYGLTFGQQYYFAVRAYGSDGQVSAWSEEVRSILFHIAQPLAVGVSADKASPQPFNTRVLWTATATGGTPPYTYTWSVQNSTGAQVTTATGATFLWQQKDSGTYTVQVRARDALMNEALLAVPYVLTRRGKRGD